MMFFSSFALLSSIVRDIRTNKIRRRDSSQSCAWFVFRSSRRASEPCFAGGKLQDLHTKVSTDATAEVEAFKPYSEWCKENAQDDAHQQETLNANIASTKAAIEKDAAQVKSSGADIACLANVIALADAELAAARAVRQREATEHSWSETELVDVVDTLERAISVIQRKMAKNLP